MSDSTESALVYQPLVVDSELKSSEAALGRIKRPRADSTGAIPKGQEWVGRRTKKLWDHLYDAVMTKYGEVSVSHRCMLQTIVRAEAHCQLAEKLRNEKWEKLDLTIDQFERISSSIVKNSVIRDKIVLRMGIDQNLLDVFGEALDEDPADSGGAI